MRVVEVNLLSPRILIHNMETGDVSDVNIPLSPSETPVALWSLTPTVVVLVLERNDYDNYVRRVYNINPTNATMTLIDEYTDDLSSSGFGSLYTETSVYRPIMVGNLIVEPGGIVLRAFDVNTHELVWYHTPDTLDHHSDSQESQVNWFAPTGTGKIVVASNSGLVTIEQDGSTSTTPYNTNNPNVLIGVFPTKDYTVVALSESSMDSPFAELFDNTTGAYVDTIILDGGA